MPDINGLPEINTISSNDFFVVWNADTSSTRKIKASNLISYFTSAIPARVEAESYAAMSGIQTESSSEGGLNVGFIDFNDWMEYSINPTSAGTYTFTFRVASPNSGASFQLLRNAVVLATVNVPNTGGWQAWQSVQVSASLTTSGPQTIRIQSNAAPRWNINWFEFVRR